MLINKKCKPCEGGMPPLTNNGIEKYIKELNAGWKVVENDFILAANIDNILQ
jgi:4a-hydroxytetrahydrobiopterin dehydratase